MISIYSQYDRTVIIIPLPTVSYDDYEDEYDYIYYEVPAKGYHLPQGGYGAPAGGYGTAAVVPVAVGGGGGGGKGKGAGKGKGKGKGGRVVSGGHIAAPAVSSSYVPQAVPASYHKPAVPSSYGGGGVPSSSYGPPGPIVSQLGGGSSYSSKK